MIMDGCCTVARLLASQATVFAAIGIQSLISSGYLLLVLVPELPEAMRPSILKSVKRAFA
jgi:hypothetical protein